jgi:hypothetical protein
MDEIAKTNWLTDYPTWEPWIFRTSSLTRSLEKGQMAPGLVDIRLKYDMGYGAK